MFVSRIFRAPLSACNFKELLVKVPQICLYSNRPLTALTNIGGVVEEQKPAKKKTVPIQRITLLTGNDLSISTVEEAQKIAKRRDLKLVKILDLDTKTQRPIYKLMTGAEYHAEDLKQREMKREQREKTQIKGEKLLIVSQNIAEHDLQVNINKICKWLMKKYEVRMVINGSAENMSKSEDVFTYLSKNLGDRGRILQKRQKGSDIKFQIIPPKEAKSDNDGNQPP